MTFRFSRRWLVLGACLLAAGCAKKITQVDASFTTPEGTFSPSAHLIVQDDQPTRVFTFLDRPPAGGGAEDTLISIDSIYPIGPGAVDGMVIDGTAANTYQVLRRESSGGYAQLKDFPVQPTVRWLESGNELYRFTDVSPSGAAPYTYVGRGVVNGLVTSSSPLTNVGVVSSGAVGNVTFTGNRFPVDSLFDLSWRSVSGAVGYWIQVFQYEAATPDQKITLSAPAAIAIGHVVDFWVAYVAAPDTTYKLGGPNGQVFARRLILKSGEYNVRISAVAADGHLLAFTLGDPDTLRGTTTFGVYLRGAVVLSPQSGSAQAMQRPVVDGAALQADLVRRASRRR